MGGPASSLDPPLGDPNLSLGPITFSDAMACSFADSIGGSFPVPSHRCHHKQKHCPPTLSGGGLPATPLLFHPHTKGSQILMDLSHKAVKRQASFCNAITFSNRPVLIYEQVRLKVGTPGPLPLTFNLFTATVCCSTTSLPFSFLSISSFLLSQPSWVARFGGSGLRQPIGRPAPWAGWWAGMSHLVSFLAVEPTPSPRSSDQGGRGKLRLLTPCGQITKKQCCWSGALRLGFTSKDPSRIHPDSLPKYACPDLVSQSGFWAKALPEEFANEGNIIAFWVDKKGRVFYRINESAAMLFFSGVRTVDPLWALVDVYGLTRGVQLLGEWLLSGPLVAGAGTNLHSHESWWLLVASIKLGAQEQLHNFPVNSSVLFLATALASGAY